MPHQPRCVCCVCCVCYVLYAVCCMLWAVSCELWAEGCVCCVCCVLVYCVYFVLCVCYVLCVGFAVCVCGIRDQVRVMKERCDYSDWFSQNYYVYHFKVSSEELHLIQVTFKVYRFVLWNFRYSPVAQDLALRSPGETVDKETFLKFLPLPGLLGGF